MSNRAGQNRISRPGDISALIERILSTPGSAKGDHLGTDLTAEQDYAVASLERSYELLLRYLNRANITKNSDGVDMTLHLLNAGNTGVSALLLLLHGYPFQASILLRHIVEVTGLVHASCLDVKHWDHFHEKRGRASYQKLLGVAQKVVPSIRQIHGRLSNYSQHINPMQGALPLSEKVGDKVRVAIAGYDGPGLSGECSKVAKWLCATLCHLEVAVERLTFEFATQPRFWIKEGHDGRVGFRFDAASETWRAMQDFVDSPDE